MSSAPQFYIDHSQQVDLRCTGCLCVRRKMFGEDADRLICCRHPHPSMQFLFGPCKDYSMPPRIRELISIIENILVTKS